MVSAGVIVDVVGVGISDEGINLFFFLYFYFICQVLLYGNYPLSITGLILFSWTILYAMHLARLNGPGL